MLSPRYKFELSFNPFFTIGDESSLSDREIYMELTGIIKSLIKEQTQAEYPNTYTLGVSDKRYVVILRKIIETHKPKLEIIIKDATEPTLENISKLEREMSIFKEERDKAERAYIRANKRWLKIFGELLSMKAKVKNV